MQSLLSRTWLRGVSQRSPRSPRSPISPIRLQTRKLSDFTATIQTLTDSFITLHSSLGVPWWVLVPMVTFAFRSTITLPLAVLNRKRILKQRLLRPILDSMYPILKFNLMRKVLKRNKVSSSTSPSSSSSSTTAAATTTKNPNDMVVSTTDPFASLSYEQVVLLAAKEKRKRQKKLYRENRCQVWKNFCLPVLQIPLWIMVSLTIRNLCGWNSFLISSGSEVLKIDPSLLDGGILWFSDLSHADPYGILPVMLGVVSLTNMELVAKFNPMGKNSSGSGSSGRFVKDTFSNRRTVYDSMLDISRLSVVFLMGIASQAPAILTLYWISSNVFSLIQNVVLQYVWPLNPGFYNENFMINDQKVYSKETETLSYMNDGGRLSNNNGEIKKMTGQEVDDLLKLEMK